MRPPPHLAIFGLSYKIYHKFPKQHTRCSDKDHSVCVCSWIARSLVKMPSREQNLHQTPSVGNTTTVFCQINAPGAEAETEKLSLSDFNETYYVDSTIP